MFGFEESYGCLSGTHARDKDAVVASMLFAELACFEENEGSSVYDRLQKIYKEYGYFLERAFSFGFTGIDAMDKMNKIMNDIRTSDISSVQGKKVLALSDYLTGVTTKCDGTKEKSLCRSPTSCFTRLKTTAGCASARAVRSRNSKSILPRKKIPSIRRKKTLPR